MRSSGFLIRFIDIGLIVLFGFLWISDIDTYSRIDMPGSQPSQPQSETSEISYLRVQIEPGGIFTVISQETSGALCRDVGLQALESCLVDARDNLQSEGRRTVVLVEPSESSIVQHTVDVLDVCDRHGISKNINARELEL